MRLWLLAVLCTTGCYTDEYGVRGTKYMLAEMAKARKDGSLACGISFTRRTAMSPFDVMCRYAAEAKACSCTVESADRFAEDIREGLYRPLYVFPIDPCTEWLPNGLEFPLAPSLMQTLKDIQKMAEEFGLTLPQELR